MSFVVVRVLLLSKQVTDKAFGPRRQSRDCPIEVRSPMALLEAKQIPIAPVVLVILLFQLNANKL